MQLKRQWLILHSAMSQDDLAHELEFISYQAARNQSPTTSVNVWRLIFTDVDLLERRYQRERACWNEEKEELR